MQFARFTRGFAALCIIASSVFAPAQTVDGKPEVKKQVLDAMTNIVERRAFVPGVDFSKWEEFLEKNREKIDGSATDEEFAFAVNSALRQFGLSHIVLHTPKVAESRRTNSSIGIGITPQPVADGIMIMRVIPGGAAEKAGLKPGDTIIEVDGNRVEGTKGIAGAEGTDLTLKIKLASGETKDFKLTRSRFSTKWPEELTQVNTDTMKIEIRTFDFSYDRANVEKLMIQASKAKNLIIDLRGNPGGAVINLQHFLGFFIDPDDSVGTFVNRRMLTAYQDETKKEELNLVEIAKWADPDRFSMEQVRPFKTAVPRFTGNIAVLVDSNSGSAAEMAAAALRDLKDARVVGRKSAGAVLASFIVPIPAGFQLQYPIQDYVTKKGLRLEGNGVIPDAAQDGPRLLLPGQPDPVIEKAVALLSGVRL